MVSTELTAQEMAEAMNSKAQRGLRIACSMTILAAKTFHSMRPYPFVGALIGVSLGVSPFFSSERSWKDIAAQGIAVPILIASAAGLKQQADADDQEEDDRQFIHDIERQAHESAIAVQAEASYLALREDEYSRLPIHVRPDRYDVQEFSGKRKSVGAQFMENAAEAMRNAFADLPDDEDELGATVQLTGAIATQFREVDLAAVAARNDKSLLISGVSGVGKTRFLQHLIHAINREYQGGQVISGIDFKGSKEHFCGLERSVDFVVSSAPGHNYSAASAVIETVVEMLGSRDEDFPYYLMADEINNGLKQAQAQQTQKGERKPEEVLRANLAFIATQGRERLIRGILTAHGNLMGLLGIDGDTAQSLVCLVLGRKLKPGEGDGFALIGKVLKNQVLFDKVERARLSREFDNIRAVAERTEQAIALTNINGGWEFVFLPVWYKDDPGRVAFEPQNQSITQLMSPPPLPPPRPAPPVLPSVPLPPDILQRYTPYPELLLVLGQVFAAGGLVTTADLGTMLPQLRADIIDLLLSKLAEDGAIAMDGNVVQLSIPGMALGAQGDSRAGEFVFDSTVYSRLQQWLVGTGARFFERGEIHIRDIYMNFKHGGTRMNADDVRNYLAEMLKDGLGAWCDSSQTIFRVNMMTDDK
jgi:hypothetical protein